MSLILCIAAIALWVRSEWRSDHIELEHSDGHSVWGGCWVTTASGDVAMEFHANRYKPHHWTSYNNRFRDKGVLSSWSYHSADTFPRRPDGTYFIHLDDYQNPH